MYYYFDCYYCFFLFNACWAEKLVGWAIEHFGILLSIYCDLVEFFAIVDIVVVVFVNI